MQERGYRVFWTAAVAAAFLLLSGGSAIGQVPASTNSSIPDAQIEANVLKALAGAPQLANQNISTNTVFGTVTLSGVVQTEEERSLAETLASKAEGVKKVVDELTLGNPESEPQRDEAGGASPGEPQYAPEGNSPPGNMAAPEEGESYPPDGQNGESPENGGSLPPGNGQPYPPPSSSYPPSVYQQSREMPPPYGAQRAGQQVVIPSGSMVRIRINQGLDSKHSQPGTRFDATVLNDVVAGGAIAIPRGATVEGTVVGAKSGGLLKGRGELSLQLTQVALGGKTYPIISDVWARDSSDKSLQTVNNAVGLGAVGALLGAVAGGGAGAAIGAGVGGAAGIGTSAATGSRQVLVPPEAILTFHLTQPATVATVSQAEMDRLSSGVPAGAQRPMMRRRYPPPYYRPYPYPYPYGYPYPYPY